MADQSRIEWCDATWNPVVGCTRVSEGCRNCYAERVAKRLAAMGQEQYQTVLNQQDRWNGRVNVVPSALDLPFRWKKPRRIFVNSMSDLFHENVPDGFIMQVFNAMWRLPRHTFIVLTKRPERMRDFMVRLGDCDAEDPSQFKNARGPEETQAAHPSGRGQLFAEMLRSMGTPPKGCAYPTFDWMGGMLYWPDYPPNVWLGVSVEDQAAADARIPELVRTPAAVRFVSVEPMLGAVDLEFVDSDGANRLDALRGYAHIDGRNEPWKTGALNWVIVGGESGPNARPVHPDWVRSVRDQCVTAGVPFFFKQWGEWAPMLGHTQGVPVRGEKFTHADGTIMGRAGKRAAGAPLEGVEHKEFPEAAPWNSMDVKNA